ncbi:class I adenylate-forming enzyme family protein [Micromonospora sp. NPDC048170]|uniref:class I adenylate-forming enzyme family protein n=1 Tax=Micromonospora sp. NPDC048170 TaxID=3154819 RepID=UPI0033C70AC4
MRPDRLLHDLLDDAADRWPSHPAVSAGETTWTYRDLAVASSRIAGWLARRGIRPGQRVVAVAPSAVGLVALVYATSRLGAVFSLLHEQVRGPALAHVLDDCEPVLLVSDDDAARTLAADRGVPTAGVAELAAVGTGPGATRWEPARRPLVVDPICLIYTSGTTAQPKAVVSTHQQVAFVAGAIQSVLGYRADDVVYCPLPLSFDVGLYQLFLAALSGAQVRLGSQAEVGPPLPGILERTGATVLPAVPAVAEALARLQRRTGIALPKLRLLTTTGAAMPAPVLRDLRAGLPDLRIQVMFGLTECKRVAIMPPDGDLERPGACGVALPGTEVFTIGADGRRLPPGEIGEFVIRGPHVMAGYWRRPAETAARYHRAEGLFPELRSGDYGWLDEDGYLYFHGRRDDIYKERGFRVSTTEVEAAARRCPEVETAVVLAPTEGRPAVLVAVADGTADELLRAMRGQIEEYKVPRRALVVPALPLTANGKVDRRAVAALVEERHHV